MDRFEDLRTFVAVVEAGSFTAAAGRVGANKSAVSRRIAALESRLGIQLLTRTTRSLSLTETGRSFFERAARILADLDEAESAVQKAHGELKGKLRVALPLAFGVRHMAQPIGQFARRHPGVRFELDLSDRFVDLVQDGMDVAVRIGNLRDSGLIARRLFESRLLLCASPAYLDRAGVPTQPSDLAAHRCLTYSNLPDPERWEWLDGNGDRQSVVVDVALRANSGEYLCRAAVDGFGMILQPTFVVHDLIRNGDLVPVLPSVRWPSTMAWAVYPPARHLSYRVREFIDFLADWFAGSPYWDQDCAAESR